MKNLPLYKKYANEKPIGIKSFNWSYGIYVYYPLDDDKYDTDFITAWSNGKLNWTYSRNKIHYSTSGRPFLRKGNLRIYLDDVMRTNYPEI